MNDVFLCCYLQEKIYMQTPSIFFILSMYVNFGSLWSQIVPHVRLEKLSNIVMIIDSFFVVYGGHDHCRAMVPEYFTYPNVSVPTSYYTYGTGVSIQYLHIMVSQICQYILSVRGVSGVCFFISSYLFMCIFYTCILMGYLYLYLCPRFCKIMSHVLVSRVCVRVHIRVWVS